MNRRDALIAWAQGEGFELGNIPAEISEDYEAGVRDALTHEIAKHEDWATKAIEAAVSRSLA